MVSARCQFALMGCLLAVCLAAVGTLRADDKPDPLAVFGTEFVAITPGKGQFPATFKMGESDDATARPVLEVRMTGAFQMAKYEVPQNLYEQVMGENPSRWKGPRNSVEMLTPGDALAFCHKATELLRERKLIAQDEEIRLPSEVEWEYCCRAGTTTLYSFGAQAQAPDDTGKQTSLLNKYAWHTGNAAGNDPPVGALAPNLWGLYDMHGYLSEICSDPWKEDYAKGSKASTDGSVVIRSGSWKDDYTHLTSASRSRFGSKAKDDAVGFRCVKAVAKAK